jgi:orotidine-5'-phosphate decarboxylase
MTTPKQGIILACDMSPGQYDILLDVLGNEPGLVGLKLGFVLGLRAPLQSLVFKAKQVNPDLHVTYDHQKAGTDVPFTGDLFADVLSEAKIDSAILFPLAGPATQRDWIKALQNRCITPILGGCMTHVHFMMHDGGYIDVNAIYHMYANSAKLGVTDFVMPGNKPNLIYSLIKIVLANGCPEDQLTIMAPGIENLSDLRMVAHTVKPYKFLPIIGRMVYESDNPLTLVREATDILGEHV